MKDNTPETNDLGLNLGMCLLRLWLGFRSLLTGIEKFAGNKNMDSAVMIDGTVNEYGLTETTMAKTYSIENYSGVPAALYDQFGNEPLIPGFALNLYDIVLGPALILLGITLLLGLATRISLFLMGLVYVSLTFGLILIKQDAGVAWLGIHIILIVMALRLAPHNCLAVTKKW